MNYQQNFRKWSQILVGVFVFKNFGKGLQLKTTTLLVLFLGLVKSLKYFIIACWSHREICHLFSDFQYGFRFFRSTADLRAVLSDRIARAFNRSISTVSFLPQLDSVRLYDLSGLKSEIHRNLLPVGSF